MKIQESGKAIAGGGEKEHGGLPSLITAPELAQIMNISVRTLWRLLSAGELIEPIKIGGNTRWRLGEVKQWIDEGCPAPVRQEG